MIERPLAHLSSRPDPVQLEGLAAVQRMTILIVSALAAVTLAGWLVPPIGRSLPSGWSLMKANTALMAGCGAWSLSLSLPGRSQRALLVSRLLAVLVLVVSGLTLIEYALHLSLGLDTLLATDGLASLPGRMSPQTATVFCLLSVVMFFVRARKQAASVVADICLTALCLLVLTIFSGYLFGAVHMFGLSPGTRTSPQTLLSLMLLSFIACARRAEYGGFAILLGIGMGGRIARIATPFALALPFALQAGSFALARSGSMSLQYATATMTSVAAMMAFGLVILLARRIDQQEREVRDLSLRDGLTGLYNHRGFQILAEQALRLSQRANEPFSVLFIDLDNLKPVNDSFGHDAGSQFLCEVADLLKLTFRKTDIVGRIGGDEFVVAGEAGELEMSIAATRLEEAAVHLSAQPGRIFPIRFSLGLATLEPGQQDSLEHLMKLADNIMYEAKQRKKTESPTQPAPRR